MTLAIWPSLMNPAVRLVMLGFGFTVGGLLVVAMQWKDRQTRRQTGATYRTSMERLGSILASAAAVLFLVAGIASIALGMVDLAK